MLFNVIDAERIGGFANSGTFCLWCNCHYPEVHFRHTIDVCGPCDDFRMKHYHDPGNFFVRTVYGIRFRVYVPDDPVMSKSQIDEYLRSLL